MDSRAIGSAAFRVSHVVVQRQPQAAARARGAAGSADALLIDIPFGGLAADELQGARGVFQRGLDRRRHPGDLRLPRVAVIDRDDRNAGGEAALEAARIFLVASDPAAAMNEEEQRASASSDSAL